MPLPDLKSGSDDDDEPEPKRVKGGFRLRSLCPHDHGRTNDEIHKTVELCPVVKAIMGTPQVQRLRYLKQLGTAEQTYMNVNHSRFEHSVGVAHLAECMAHRLQNRQPNLKITDKDVLCVKLAGLCHDLGHGPFSHVYMNKRTHVDELTKHLEKNPELLKHYEGIPPIPRDWKHEDASLMMIDAALEHLGLAIDMHNLDLPLRQIGDGIQADSMRVYKQYADEDGKPNPQDILTSRDWIFIKECILGHPIGRPQPVDAERSGFLGRPYRRQEFLYDIVANRHTGLDVDKIDYFARDDRRANGGSGEIEIRMIDEAVVARAECPQPKECFACNEHDPGDHLMICYPEKMDRCAMAFFNKRFDFHASIYTHKTSMAATFMICDIFTHADPFFRIPTVMDGDVAPQDGMPAALPISRAMLHKTSYLRLRDGVIDQIMATQTPELRKARSIIERLWNRDLYKCAATKPIDVHKRKEKAVWDKSEADIKKEILQLGGVHGGQDGELVCLNEEDIIVEKCKMHHGQGEDNPVMLMRFLPKDELPKLTRPFDQLPTAVKLKDEVISGNTPRAMQEQSIRVFCRGDSNKLDLLRHVFCLWAKEVEEEFQFTVEEANSDSDYGEESQPAALTQDSVGSPIRSYQERDREQSPLPFNSRDRYQY